MSTLQPKDSVLKLVQLVSLIDSIINLLYTCICKHKIASISHDKTIILTWCFVLDLGQIAMSFNISIDKSGVQFTSIMTYDIVE